MFFETNITARFHEVDRAGIVFFGRAFEYAHICFEEMLTAAFGGMDAVFDRLDLGFPLVHSEASFLRPMRRGDRLSVRMTIVAFSGRSITFEYAIRGQSDGVERCRVRLKHAFVTVSTFKTRHCPDEFIHAIEHIGLSVPDDAAKC